MELQQYCRVFLNYWRSTIAVVALAGVLAACLTWIQKPHYSATASLFVAVDSGKTAGELSQGASYAERQVKSYVRVGSSAAVLQPVINELSLGITVPQLVRQLEISSPTGTSVIQVSVTDSDRRRCAQVANAVAKSLTSTIGGLAPNGSNGSGLVKATLVDPAIEPVSPSSPQPLINLAIGLVVGLALGCGQAILRHFLDTRVRTVADIERLTDAPLLATINSSTSRTEGGHAQAEAYRQLRTNVSFLSLGGERRRSLAITSAGPGEGKTETVCHLAQMLARAGDSVLLIDADLRRPKVAERLGVDSQLGLSDVLTGRIGLSDALLSLDGGLQVLPAGTVPPNPSELLSSRAMERLLAWAEKQYSYVLFDTPPLLPVTDAVVLASRTGGAIVVARHGVVTRIDLENALSLLEVGSARALGIVLNDAPRGSRTAYQGYS